MSPRSRLLVRLAACFALPLFSGCSYVLMNTLVSLGVSGLPGRAGLETALLVSTLDRPPQSKEPLMFPTLPLCSRNAEGRGTPSQLKDPSYPYQVEQSYDEPRIASINDLPFGPGVVRMVFTSLEVKPGPLAIGLEAPATLRRSRMVFNAKAGSTYWIVPPVLAPGFAATVGGAETLLFNSYCGPRVVSFHAIVDQTFSRSGTRG